MSSQTLRLVMPQWQGGNEPGYYIGAKVLEALAPQSDGPREEVAVRQPAEVENLETVDGIVGRGEVVAQAKAARAAIDKHMPDRILTLGGDCLVDLAPIAYLSEKYGDTLGVLWIDSHPDVMRPEDFAHSHAHVLGLLMGTGEPELGAEVARPVAREKVMFAGLNDWMEIEAQRIEGMRIASPEELAQNSQPVLDWIAAEGITHLAVHFDLDVLDPARFAPLLFNKPNLPADAWDGIAQGKMGMDDVVRLLSDVAGACDIVGLAIAEHLPWDMIGLAKSLRKLPLVGGD